MPIGVYTSDSSCCCAAAAYLASSRRSFSGPGPLNCAAVAAICGAHPGVFELSVPGCGEFYHHPKPGPNRPPTGCAAGTVVPGESTLSDNSIFLVSSTQPEKFPVRAAFRKFGVVPYRDFIAQSRQGLNALRQVAADIPQPPPLSTPAPPPPCPATTVQSLCIYPICEWSAAGKCTTAPPTTQAFGRGRMATV